MTQHLLFTLLILAAASRLLRALDPAIDEAGQLTRDVLAYVRALLRYLFGPTPR